MNRTEKLLHLRDILANVKQNQPENFYMPQWIHPHVDLYYLLQGDSPEECGFAGCAMGHACIDPTFMAMGLHFHRDRGPEFVTEDGVKRNFGAAMAFFELSEAEADFLFYPLTYYRSSIIDRAALSAVCDAMKTTGEVDNPLMVIHNTYIDEDDGEEYEIEDFCEEDEPIEPDMVMRRIDFLLNPDTANAITRR